MKGGKGLAGRLVQHEGWLVLAAGPPLVLREVAPTWLQVAALAWLGLLWLARRRVTGRWSVPTASDLPLLALVLTLPGALAAAAEQAGPLVRPADELVTVVGMSRLLSLVFSVALYYAIANSARTPQRAWSAVRWLLLAGLGLGVVGWLAMTGQHKFAALEPFVAWLPGIITTLPHPLLRSGMHANTVAAQLVLLLPLAFALLIWPAGAPANDGGGRPRGLRLLTLAVVVTATPLLLLSQSRGAWAALVVSLAVLAAARWPRVRTAMLAAIVLVGLGALVFGLALMLMAIFPGLWPGQEVVSWQAPGGGGGRLDLWRRCGELVAAYPWRGIGLGTFPLVFGQDPRYPGVYIYQGFAHAHNTLLQAALDYGLPGLTATVALYVTLAITARRAWLRLAEAPLALVAAGLACGLLGLAAHGMVDAVAIGSKSGVLAWAYAGLLAALRYHSRAWMAPSRVSEPEISR